MNTYYVYGHYDIEGDCVYVGMGQKSRAWDVHSGHSKTKPYSQGRIVWFKEQLALGRLPGDWVVILHRDLSKADAARLEKEFIVALRPRLNTVHNPDKPHHFRKVTSNQLKEASEMRESGSTWIAVNTAFGYKRGTLEAAMREGRKGAL